MPQVQKLQRYGGQRIGPNGGVLRPSTLYPTEQASPAEAAETLKAAAEIIDAPAKLVPNLGFF